MAEKPFAEYVERNAAPILEILKREFRDSQRVLEIGSGTGQHAVTFATVLDHLALANQRSGRESRGHHALGRNTPNLKIVSAPLSLDVRTARVAEDAYDAAYLIKYRTYHGHRRR